MSVYQYNPPAVGFAALSSTTSTLATGSLPSPTVGADTVSPSKGTGGASSLMFRTFARTGGQGGDGWGQQLWTAGVIVGVTSGLMYGISLV